MDIYVIITFGSQGELCSFEKEKKKHSKKANDILGQNHLTSSSSIMCFVEVQLEKYLGPNKLYMGPNNFIYLAKVLLAMHVHM